MMTLVIRTWLNLSGIGLHPIRNGLVWVNCSFINSQGSVFSRLPVAIKKWVGYGVTLVATSSIPSTNSANSLTGVLFLAEAESSHVGWQAVYKQMFQHIGLECIAPINSRICLYK